MITLNFYAAEDPEEQREFWSVEAPSVPRVGDVVRLVNRDGGRSLDGRVGEVCWGQYLTTRGGVGLAWIPVPGASLCVHVTVEAASKPC